MSVLVATSKTDEEREQWVLDPLVGVGPLRFGMSPDEVDAVFRPKRAEASDSWGMQHSAGVELIYGEGGCLVAVAVDGPSGPLVRLRDVELIGRVPSEVRADIHELARREGASVRVNRSGDPEVGVWGLSMGVEQRWPLEQQGSAMFTSALFVGPERAEDPHGTKPATWERGRRYDVRDGEGDSGTWPVTAERDRPLWDCTPLERVGPLRFGMTPEQVAAALDEAPAESLGVPPLGAWSPRTERFDVVGVTADYATKEGFPSWGP